MRLKPWVVFLGPLLLLDAALIFVVVSYRRGGSSSGDAAPVSSPVVSPGDASVSLARVVPAAPPAMQTACVDGETWGYWPDRRRWAKLMPLVRCRVGDVREVLERDGVVTRYPKASR